MALFKRNDNKDQAAEGLAEDLAEGQAEDTSQNAPGTNAEDAPGDTIPWHWHEELEVIFVAAGDGL